MRVRLASAAVLAVLLTTTGCASDDDANAGSESSEGGRSVDPKTLQGSCSMLIGPEEHFVDEALDLGRKIADGQEADVSAAQNNLFKLVVAGAPEIQDPAGQLVDYLDDPAAYQTTGGVGPTITDAVASIEKACAK